MPATRRALTVAVSLAAALGALPGEASEPDRSVEVTAAAPVGVEKVQVATESGILPSDGVPSSGKTPIEVVGDAAVEGETKPEVPDEGPEAPASPATQQENAGEKPAEKPSEPAGEKAGEEAEKEGEKKPEPPKHFINTPVERPLGAAGRSTVPAPPQGSDHFVPIPDRWRIGFPEWDRYRSGLGAPYRRSRGILDPYNQNILKGDYPVFGQDVFMNLGVISDTLVDFRSRYIPSNVSSRDPGQYPFFGNGRLDLIDQTFFVTTELFKGNTAFRPKDWAFRATGAFNINDLSARETGVPHIDVREGAARTNLDAAIQELYGEYKIADLSANYDFLSVRAGIQGFTADFRGFLFVDNQPGVRFFGNTGSNRNQFNLAYFHPLEKDTYSRLNRIFRDRGQDILIANYYRQDLFRPGYTGQFTVAYNSDHGDRHFDNNGIRVRPVLIGDARPHKIRTAYLGWNGDGHLGRYNLSHSFYQVFGTDTHNPIAGQRTSVNAQMGAAELSYDKDWIRFKSSFFYASGDSKPRDGRARGFDAITDNPIFSGAGFSFWQSQGLRLPGTFVDLVSESSLLPALRASKLEGQPNHVNPGIMIANVGTDVELTPKWRMSANINWLSFVKTQPLELVLNQSNINRHIGFDYSLGFRHRPFLNDNVIFTFGVSALVPGAGFRDIYTGKTVFSSFARLTLAY